MSHYGHRHHRLNAGETGPVFSLVYRELWRLYEARGDPEAAGALTRVFHRFMENKIGPPKYPRVWGVDDEGRRTFNWGLLYAHLVEWSTYMEADADNVTITEAEAPEVQE